MLRVLAALARLDGDEEYVFIGHWSEVDWLKPLLGERQTIVRAPRPERYESNRIETLKHLLEP